MTPGIDVERQCVAIGEERHFAAAFGSKAVEPSGSIAAQAAMDLARDLLAGAEQASGKGADRQGALGQASAE